MDILQLLSEKHKDWIKMTKSLGSKSSPIDNETANDIVSDMYIRLYKYVDTPDRIMFTPTEVNTMFVYVTLRNLYYNHCNTTNKYKSMISTVDIEQYEHIPLSEYNTPLEVSKINIQDDILKEINSWHHYDTKLFKIVFYEGVSMRKLSRETGISVSSIFNSIKTGKQKLRVKFKQDYEQLLKLK